MNCDHCFYEFSKIYPTFQGLPILDEHYNFEIYRFCSLNCGLAFIMNNVTSESKNLPQRLKNFFDFYNVDPKSFRQSLPRESLKVFNGSLDYETYRKDFITPFIDPFFGFNEENFSLFESFPNFPEHENFPFDKSCK
jgi:hypothetical protein